MRCPPRITKVCPLSSDPFSALYVSKQEALRKKHEEVLRTLQETLQRCDFVGSVALILMTSVGIAPVRYDVTDFSKPVSSHGLGIEDVQLAPEELEMYLDLLPFLNASPYFVSEDMSLNKVSTTWCLQPMKPLSTALCGLVPLSGLFLSCRILRFVSFCLLDILLDLLLSSTRASIECLNMSPNKVGSCGFSLVPVLRFV